MKRGKKKSEAEKAPPKKEKESVTGTYVYDPEVDGIVKISDRIPSVASKGSQGPKGDPPCGGGACGSCPHGKH